MFGWISLEANTRTMSVFQRVITQTVQKGKIDDDIWHLIDIIWGLEVKVDNFFQDYSKVHCLFGLSCFLIGTTSDYNREIVLSIELGKLNSFVEGNLKFVHFEPYPFFSNLIWLKI